MAFLLLGLMIGFVIGRMYQQRHTNKEMDRFFDHQFEPILDQTVGVGIDSLKTQCERAEWERDAAMALYKGIKSQQTEVYHG